MNERNPDTEYHDCWDTGEFRTGTVEPPRRHSGLVALLLIAVIILSGMCVILGAVNVRLFAALNGQTNADVSVSRLSEDTAAPSASPLGNLSGQSTLGLSGETVTQRCQNYYDLPPGLFIDELTPGGAAQLAGIRQGDVLIGLNGDPITSEDELSAALRDYDPGDRVQLELYRQGRHIRITVTVEEYKG